MKIVFQVAHADYVYYIAETSAAFVFNGTRTIAGELGKFYVKVFVGNIERYLLLYGEFWD